MRPTGTAALILAALGLLAFASPAAADRIYFGSNSRISYVNLDGSGGGNLNTGAATVDSVRGIAIDPAAGRIYWVNGEVASKISWANLDGSGGGDLAVTGPAAFDPRGLAIDHAAGRLYWSNNQAAAQEAIAYSSFDASVVGFLPTTGATASEPTGVAIDPASGRLYWSNYQGKISYANLDGSGGGDINTSGSLGALAEGVAIDPTRHRIYWADHETAIPYFARISYANLDGSGGGDMPTEETLDFPIGVAIDPTVDRAYWANSAAFSGTGSISYGSLEGGGGGSLNMAGAVTSPGIAYPALLKAPLGTGAPKLDAQIALRPRFLTCDEGTWAGDIPEAQFYRAPQSFSYQWTKDGQPVPGATRSNIGVEGSPGGDYACQVTATNAGGSTTQTSRTQFVCCPLGPRATAARLALVRGGKAMLKLTCPPGAEPCAGRLRLESSWPGRKLRKPPVTYGERSFSVPGGVTATVKVKLSRQARSRLRTLHSHRLRAGLEGSGVDHRVVLLKLAKKKPKRR
ncbi:MAG TPA: hypothetical protein VGF09_09625 [Solirubrobacterales bacterium]